MAFHNGLTFFVDKEAQPLWGALIGNSKQLHNAGGRISFLLTLLPASQKVVFLCKQKVSMVFQKNIQRLDKVMFQSRTVQACNPLAVIVERTSKKNKLTK